MIRLNSLQLENFMNIKTAQFDFDHNVIIISGKSGQGKSAVFDAIALCLSQKKRSSTYSDYVKQGSTHSKIVLDCLINNESVHFDLQINLVRGTPYQMALTYKNQTYRNTEAEALLKTFDIDYFTDIIFSMQSDDYRDITQLGPTQRSIYLQRLLNFDFQKQKDQINKNLEEYKVQLSKIETNINVKEQFIKREKEGEEELVKINLTDKDIQKLQKNIQEQQEKILLYQKSQQQVIELNNQISELSKDILSFNLEKNNINNRLNLIKEKKEKLEKSEQNLSEILLKISATEKALKATEDKIKDNTIKELALETECISLENQLKIKKDASAEYSRYAALEEAEKCPLCGQDLKELLDAKLKEAMITYVFQDKQESREDDSFNKRNNELKDIIEKELEELRTKEIEKDLYRLQFKENEKIRINYSSQLEICIKEKERTLSEIEELEDNFDESLTLQESLTELEKKIKNNVLETEKLNNKIKSISKTEDISILSTEIVNNTNIINKYFSDNQINNEIKSRNETRQKNIELYKKEIKVFNEETKNILVQQAIYEDAFNILDKALPNYMVVKTCSSLQNEMNSFIQSIFPLYEVQLVNSKKGCEFFYTKDKNILEQTKRNNAWINSKMSSGFEKALLTIAFKVSLAQLYGINIFIGDEVDGAADDESSEKFFELLTTNSTFDQLFLISHKKAICRLITDTITDSVVYTASQGQFALTEVLE